MQKALLQLNKVLMVLLQNTCSVFFTQIELFIHAALEGS